jgi:DNA-binding beta-propeller fold protein YncE
VSATTEFDVDWAQTPGGASLGDVPCVEVDGEDRVYAFTRGETPLVVFDRDGNVLTSWDRGGFDDPHGIRIGPDGSLWLTDDGDHTIRRCTLEGEVLQTIGTPGRPAPFMSGRPFNKPTNIAFGPQGDIYVSDGYGNAQIHRLSPDGELIQTWGESGSDPGQFYIPHDIRCDEQGFVYVADRENHRVQVFDGDGGVQAVWGRLHRPCGLAIAGEGDRRRVYVAELGPLFRNQVPFAPNLGSRVTVLDGNGDVLGRHGAPDRGTEPDQFIAPHGIAVDSHGDVYVGEVSGGQWPSSSSEPVPPSLTTLRKLTGLGY